MTDDLQRQMEQASLLPDRYYLIMNYQDEDSFSMTAYDTTKEDGIDMENVPAGMVILNGMIELMENDLTVFGMREWLVSALLQWRSLSNQRVKRPKKL